MPDETNTISEEYERDGFVFPIDIVDETEARNIQADLEAAERELANKPEKLALLLSYPVHLLPSFPELIRHPKLLEVVEKTYGSTLDGLREPFVH